MQRFTQTTGPVSSPFRSRTYYSRNKGVCTGLTPFGILNFMNYIHHSRQTQCAQVMVGEIFAN